MTSHKIFGKELCPHTTVQSSIQQQGIILRPVVQLKDIYIMKCIHISSDYDMVLLWT